MTEFSYTVTHIDSSTDITNFVEWIEWFEIGTGDVTHATLRVNTFGSKFISAAPVIDEFHKIRLQVTDHNGLTFDRVYEVENLIPIESSQEGNAMDIELLGLEWHLQKSFFSKPFYFASAYDVVKDLGDIYNGNKGSLDPLLEDHDNNTGNKLPKWTSNVYDFNIAEKRAYDGMADVVEKLGNTVANGGGGDFWELFFIKHPSDNTKFKMRAFVSGSLPAPGSEIILTDVDEVNGDPTEGGIVSTPATIVAGWGADGFGTLPPDTSQFHGILEAYNVESYWVDPATSGQPYPQDASVQYQGVHYESNINNNSSTPPTNWTIKREFDHLGALKYSPWTDGKAGEWKNSGANPSGSGSGFAQKGCWDSNLVIWDNTHYRTQVVMRVKNPADIDTVYLYSGIASGVYRGFRVLVDTVLGAVGGVFASNDINGKAFANNIAQYDGTRWTVFRVTANNEEVAVTHEGAVYVKAAGVWASKQTEGKHNDCFHYYSNLVNTAGINITPKNFPVTQTYGDTSAIEVTYQYTCLSSLAAFVGVANTAGYYSSGAWLNLRFPFPFSTHNGVSSIGVFWGNNSSKKEPVTLDTNNMHFTHSALNGFNNTESEDLGPISAVAFSIKHQWLDGTGAQMVEGDFKYRIALYDSSDNVVVADFIIPFNNYWADIQIPLSDFKIYRARLPLFYSPQSFLSIFVLNALDILNVFEWQNIKSMCIQWQEAYDSEGRYYPEGGRIVKNPLFTSVSTPCTVTLTLDRFHFVKPLLSVTDPVTTGRAIMMDFRQNPLITNKQQLDQDVESWLQVAKFRHKQYDIRTEGNFNIAYGDTFFLRKSDLVADADTRTADSGGTANSIRLVAKGIKYKITKTTAEAGNFLRWITGIKRLVS